MSTTHIGTGAHHRASTAELRAKSQQVARDATTLGQSMTELLREGYAYTGGLMRERPYLMLAAATGAGYILGGGLGSRLTASIVAVGGRMLARNLAARALAGAANGAEESPFEH